MQTKFSLAITASLMLLACLWLVHAVSMPSETMIGDRFGYDPGSRFLPLASAILMIGALLIELLRTRDGFASMRLIRIDWPTAVHMIALCAYIVLFQKIGFVVSTAALLFGLITFNCRQSGVYFRNHMIPIYGVGLLVAIIACFAGLRFIADLCYDLADSRSEPILRSPAILAGFSALGLALAFCASEAVARNTCLGPLFRIAQLALFLTLVLYTIFRILFFVRLPDGVLAW